MPRKLESLRNKLAPMLDKGWYWAQETGQLTPGLISHMSETPWIYHNLDFRCVLWHEIFFETVSGSTMVHSHCQECFKVVISPRTFEELVMLENWQATLDGPCKCGIEIRDFVNRKRLYGGYFYNRGLEDGKECYEFVREWADNTHTHDKDWYTEPQDGPMPVLLKRGCTEFERSVGPSSFWGVDEEQERLEKEIGEAIDFDPFKASPTPDILKQGVRMDWMRWAHHHNDMTYVRFMPDGKPFDELPMYHNPPYVTYHDADPESR